MEISASVYDGGGDDGDGDDDDDDDEGKNTHFRRQILFWT